MTFRVYSVFSALAVLATAASAGEPGTEAPAGSAKPEFCAHVDLGRGPLFLLKSGESSRWVGVGSEFGGFKVSGFDQKSQTLYLQKSGQAGIVPVRLVSGRVIEGALAAIPIPANPLPSPASSGLFPSGAGPQLPPSVKSMMLALASAPPLADARVPAVQGESIPPPPGLMPAQPGAILEHPSDAVRSAPRPRVEPANAPTGR